ncbi:MAG: maleylpyruvate isomerase family mycothiol-dependent enzyme [Candidatus Dormibacteria bacterium]
MSLPGVVAELEAVWASLAGLTADMDDGQWRRATGCPGWEVRDLVAHVVGTERSLAGEHEPGAPERYPQYVRNPIGEFNERWVAHLRVLSRRDVVTALREVTAKRLQMLSALSEADWSAPSWTPAGPGTYLDFMRIRVFDCWVHEQDIRWVLGKPGGMDGPWVDTALGIPRGALPKLVARGVGAPEGTLVEVVLEGEPERRWRVAVREGRGVEVHDGATRPSVQVRGEILDFVSRFCGRVHPQTGAGIGRLEVEGDLELGRRLLEKLPLPM